MSIEAIKAINMVYANTTKHDWPEDVWDAICEAIEAEKQKPVKVSPLDFVEMVYEKEHLVGRPIVWAEWPNKEEK